MPIVNFPEPQKREPHDWPRPHSEHLEKTLKDMHAYKGEIINPAVLGNAHIPKINKYIEIVMIPERAPVGMEEDNVGIILDEFTISEVLSQRYKTVCVSVIKTEDDLKNLVAKKPDLVFSGIKYFDFYNHGKKKHIWFSDYLAEHNIAYLGSTSKSYKNSYDKAYAKKIMLDAGINTAQFFTTEPSELTLDQSLQIDFPVFVKPYRGGDSKGIDANSIVTDFEGLKAKVLNIYQTQESRSLVETYLPGKEYTVGVFENTTDGKLMAMPLEIIPSKNRNGDRVLDFNVKKNNAEKVIKIRSLRIHKLTSDLAIQVFKALKATSHGRVDIKMDEYGVPYFLEANLMPGLGRGYLSRCCTLNKKMSYEQMIYKITDNALAQFPDAA